jgi:hypothetical protein
MIQSNRILSLWNDLGVTFRRVVNQWLGERPADCTRWFFHFRSE